MKKTISILAVCIALFFLTIIQSCKKEKVLTAEEIIEKALDEFAADLQSNPADTSNISARVKNYMQGRSALFYGSTVTLLDSTKKAVSSPYWFKQNDTLAYANLMDTAYKINTQLWLRETIDGGKPIWTEPYFDAGGGNIWMKTRTVPVYINGKIKAVATTDMRLK
jgi:sigma-B regulation protein RsbU (phosphoserine phosphatase)